MSNVLLNSGQTLSNNSTQAIPGATTNGILVNPLITAAAASTLALAQIESPTRLKEYMKKQAENKISSEIAILVELGNTAGTPQVPKDEIALGISQKIEALQEKARDSNQISSVRSDLCELRQIASTHYVGQKEKVFDMLIELLETDPILPKTAEDIPHIIIKLKADLAIREAQKITILFQKKVARAFSAAVGTYLRHYNKKHFGAIDKDEKNEVIQALKNLSDLNTQGDRAIEFASQTALEASKRLTTNRSDFKEFLERLSKVIEGLSKAWDNDLAGCISSLFEAFKGLEDKIQLNWFNTLFTLRDLVQKAPNNKLKVIAIQSCLINEKINQDWKILYGALEILESVISRPEIRDFKIFENALFGQPIKTSSMTTVTLPGVLNFCDCQIYKNEDNNAVRDRAEKLCKSLLEKLTMTIDGRRALSYRYQNAEDKPAVLKLLNEIPKDSDERDKWVREAPKASYGNAQTHVRKTSDANLSPTASRINDVFSQQKSSEKDSKAIATKKENAPFFQAIKDGNLLAVQRLIEQKKDLVNTKDCDVSPLMVAAKNGHLKICEELIKAGATTALSDENGRTAFLQASAAGKGDIVKFLASSRKNLNKLDINNKTALMLAAENGHKEVCQILLETSSVEEEDRSKKPEGSGRVSIVNLTRKMQLDSQDREGNTALILAARNGHSSVCQWLISNGSNLNITNREGKNVIHCASEKGQAEVITKNCEILNLSGSKTKEGLTSLMFAARCGALDVCEVLLKYGVKKDSVDENGMNALHWAAQAGKNEVIKFLLNEQPRLKNSQTKKGFTPLALAAESGKIDSWEILLKEEGVHLIDNSDKLIQVYKNFAKVISSNGANPLMIAAKVGHYQTVELLLNAGSNPVLANQDGWNALHFAANGGHLNVVNQLLAINKERINQFINVKARGKTPFMMAADQGHKEICEILLKSGAHLPSSASTKLFDFLLSVGEIVLMPFTSTETDKKELANQPPFAKRTSSSKFSRRSSSGINRLTDNLSPLHKAVIEGKIDEVRKLSVDKEILNKQTADKETALMIAVEKGKKEICEILLKADANLMLKDSEGRNVLHIAILEGNVDIVNLFLTNKDLINSSAFDNVTPFMLAARLENRSICENLLKASADPLLYDNNNFNALHHAISGGQIETIKWLLSHKEFSKKLTRQKQRSTHYTPLMLSASLGQTEVCNLLLQINQNSSKKNEHGWTALHFAANYGRLETVRLLSNDKSLVNLEANDKKTPLLKAAELGFHEICAVLVKAGANPAAKDEQGFNALHYAARTGKVEVVKSLFHSNSQLKETINSTDRSGKTALMLATKYGSLEVCKYLLGCEAEINLFDENRWNALHYAVSNNRVEIVKLFSDNNKLVSSKTLDKATPLLLAAEKGYREICEILLKAGADPRTPGKDKRNALHTAVAFGKVEVVRLLSTNPQVKNSQTATDLETPLIIAVDMGHIEICEILIKAGVDPLFANKYGRNALHQATRKENTKIVEMLIGANRELLNSKTLKFQITPLMIAAERGHAAIFEMLLKAGADPEVRNSKGINALQIASAAKNQKIVDILLKKKKDSDPK